MMATGIEWVLTWLWQGSLVTVAAAVVLRLATRASAATRYLAWWTTLGAVVVLGVASLVTVADRAPEKVSARATPATGVLATPPDLSHAPTALLPIQIDPPPSGLGPVLAVAWLAYAARRVAGLWLAVVRLRRLKRRSVVVPPHLERQLVLWQSVRDDAGRPTALCLNDGVPTASMLGLGSPVIALPPRLVGAIAGSDLDQVVVHEHAHVQRYDDWTAFGQSAIEALVGWHPAVFWIGRQLCLEREVACDDWVVRHRSAPKDYALCLTRVAAVALHQRAVTVTTPAVRSRRELLGRVERLLDARRSTTLQPARGWLAVAAFTLTTAVAVLGALPPVLTVERESPTLRLPEPRVVAARPLVTLGLDTRVRPAMYRMPPVAREPSNLRLPRTTLRVGPDPLGPPPTIRARPSGHRARPLTSTTLPYTEPLVIPARRSFASVGTSSPATRVGPPPVVGSSEDESRGPWARMGEAGKAVGVGAAEAGLVTATAFRSLGSSLTRVFWGSPRP